MTNCVSQNPCVLKKKKKGKERKKNNELNTF